MLEVRLQTELFVIQAYGFGIECYQSRLLSFYFFLINSSQESSEMGMMAYRQTMSGLMQRMTPKELEPIQTVRFRLDSFFFSFLTCTLQT